MIMITLSQQQRYETLVREEHESKIKCLGIRPLYYIKKKYFMLLGRRYPSVSI